MSVAQTPISGDIPLILVQGPPRAATPAHSLEYADELYGATSEVMALYGHHFEDPREYHYMDITLAFAGLKIRPSHLLKDIEYLVKFVVHERKANEPIAEFIRGIGDLPEWTFKGAQDELTHIPLSRSPSFESRLSELFQLSPPNGASVAPALKLKAGLLDFEGLDIKVRPTLNIDEHMTLEDDNTLKILKLSRGTWNLCLTYHENLVAKALNMDTLGSEVLGSLYTLYGEGALMRKAGEMELVEDDPELALWIRYLNDNYSKVTPRVLASRTLALVSLVEKRRSWWSTLIRDVKLQTSTQPILFYGSILAVISVISSVVQAVATVWGLVVAIKQPVGH
ncbi:uncharacterized protein LACBIDRAFT_295809 [Laccaria bicolor S238N-H82]|uniref:Predicted protein n=1 Tax=Laccaria bicolor (strain S238N-H82 / ATCC MYA-4686) TaxID=486041 RepID=B0DYN4_LACBS|nr:uncharacterized protein LACBIDRAFT_295809 [Laccaria bicolor S238N-H82]EDR00278.1 predicted protein [Laccaria bicolor S238N-H82]|eukprot:XP_001889030.1 predicted protein [Laccaria bicolor S238N-H82]